MGPFVPEYKGPVLMDGSYTVDTLPAPTVDNLGSYARVTDLFGEKTDLVLCSKYGSTFFWQPVRPVWAKSMSGNANMTLTPLKSPSIIRLTGTLTANRTINLDQTYVWPGCEFEIAFDGTLGIFGLNIAGLDLGATLSLVLGGRRRVVWDGTAYQSY